MIIMNNKNVLNHIRSPSCRFARCSSLQSTCSNHVSSLNSDQTRRGTFYLAWPYRDKGTDEPSITFTLSSGRLGGMIKLNLCYPQNKTTPLKNVRLCFEAQSAPFVDSILWHSWISLEWRWNRSGLSIVHESMGDWIPFTWVDQFGVPDESGRMDLSRRKSVGFEPRFRCFVCMSPLNEFTFALFGCKSTSFESYFAQLNCFWDFFERTHEADPLPARDRNSWTLASNLHRKPVFEGFGSNYWDS